MSEMPAEYLSVYNAIANAEGSITKEKILLQIGEDEKYTRKLHHIIHSLVVDYSVPIGSSSKESIKGYFLIKDTVQGQEALKSLSSRLDTIKKRADVVRKRLQELNGKTQLSNEEAEALNQLTADFDSPDFKQLEKEVKELKFEGEINQ